MKSHRTFAICLIVLFFGLLIISSQLNAQPKAEMRGVWVATVMNLDWPSASDLTTSEQKKEIIAILDHHQSLGLNAIFLQVRPAADALYKSSLEPWSKWLSGHQGKEPRPFYDPLQFWIDQCHLRGMELHAWFNPFRAAVSENLDLLHPDHIVRQQPEWFVNYGGRIYFNPGIPQVREYVQKVVMEVVKGYDIDGVHFDDYFYPYKVDNKVFDDHQLFNNGAKVSQILRIGAGTIYQSLLKIWVNGYTGKNRKSVLGSARLAFGKTEGLMPRWGRIPKLVRRHLMIYMRMLFSG